MTLEGSALLAGLFKNNLQECYNPATAGGENRIAMMQPRLACN